MLLPHAEVPVEVREGLGGELGLGLVFDLAEAVVQVHVGPGLGPGLALPAVGVREDPRQSRRVLTAEAIMMIIITMILVCALSMLI